MLKNIATGFKAIDKAELVHVDLHIGNILHDVYNGTNISDLGL
ncbi:32662_t:CDS:1, partial [Gigaspora margarita]